MSFEKIVLADGRATIYRGDCLELLAAGLLKCDAIVSDPPYGIGFQHGGGGIGAALEGSNVVKNAEKIHGDDQPFDPAPWLAAAPRTESKNNNKYGDSPRILLWGANNYMQDLPKGGTLLAWDKHLGQGADDSFADCEWAWCGRPVKREVFRWLWKGIIATKTPDDCSPTKGGKGHGAARFARIVKSAGRGEGIRCREWQAYRA
jgi:site-specific DNA-methyltransferase (adenine-specific)/modification methylase